MSVICFLLRFQSRARQEDPEQARLKQKAKEVRCPPADPQLGKIKTRRASPETLQSLRMLVSVALAVAPLADLIRLLMHTVRSGTVGQQSFDKV